MLVIKQLNWRYQTVPVKYNVVSSVRNSSSIPMLTLEIMTNEGLTGVSYIQVFNEKVSNSIGELVKFFETNLIDKSPLSTETLWRNMFQQAKLLGDTSLIMFTISLIDIALWDLKGKYLKLPVYQLLGSEKKPLPAYFSDALWLDEPENVVAQVEEVLAEGFTSMKVRMGREDSMQDIDVLRRIREKYGDDIEIMVDVNQGWSRQKAEKMMDLMKPYNVYWVEEPIEAVDQKGYEQLTRSNKITVTSGENLYGLKSIVDYVTTSASTVFTPDLQRIGGVTGWLKLVPFLEYYRVPCSLHLFPEYSSHLISSYPYKEKLEWMSWGQGLFKEPITCENGQLILPDRPGFGMELK